MEQTKAPLWEKLIQFQQKERLWLHVPAHGGGAGLPEEIQASFASYAQLDLTELPGLDDLFQPTGVIAEAQALAAQLFGAKRSYFLAGGASAVVRAMILAVCNPGDVIIIPRNAHASVYQALVFSGAVPYYLPTAEKNGVPLNVTVTAVESAFQRYPNAKALFLTSPSYYGVAADLKGIAAVVRRYRAYLLVDEAHGAHFDFSAVLPDSAARYCDLRVQSWHKTLGSLTPGAVLHWHGGDFSEERLLQALQGLQTSSPPYPLLASLDLTRKKMALQGKELVDKMVENALKIRGALKGSFPFLARRDVQEQGFDLDITRLTLLTAEAGICGLAAGLSLHAAGIDVELIQPHCLLAILGPSVQKKWTARLLKAIKQLQPTGFLPSVASYPALPEVVISPRQAAYCRHREVHFTQAVGLVAAAAVVCYPPGIPLLVPGERITPAICDYLQAALQQGVQFRGLTASGQIKVCDL
ncbi:MAG: aminotransferase class I/II-fold pyridoxal phosphate-dependent enzyme [Firmicutes bacterium]|nr:aminotransferase class I/II-fold pyridoxal phosphate-dependent enzyme [Bacillota bacterium]